jgi:hypothetical protein
VALRNVVQLKKRIITVSSHFNCGLIELNILNLGDVIEGTVRHQQAKEMQNDCQALKNLHAAYRKNPDKFDEEPEVLLGDVDLEEDTMVSLGLG